MAIATIEVSLPGLAGFTLLGKLFSHPNSDAVVLTIPTWTPQTNRTSTYRGVTLDPAPTGVHKLEMYESAGQKVVTGVTNANPGVVTAVAHGYSDGDKVSFESVGGTTELNGNVYEVANKTDDTFELSGIDTSAFGVYTTGGTVEKLTLRGEGYLRLTDAAIVHEVYSSPIEVDWEDGGRLDTILDSAGSGTITNVISASAPILQNIDTTLHITIHRGDEFIVSVTDLGDISARDGLKSLFTMKRRKTDPDSAALIKVAEVGGLLIINGTAATAGEATLVIDDESNGDFTLTLKSEACELLPFLARTFWDFQIVNAGQASTKAASTGQIDRDVTIQRT